MNRERINPRPRQMITLDKRIGILDEVLDSLTLSLPQGTLTDSLTLATSFATVLERFDKLVLIEESIAQKEPKTKPLDRGTAPPRNSSAKPT